MAADVTKVPTGYWPFGKETVWVDACGLKTERL